MSKSGVGSYRAQGDVIVERLRELKPPRELIESITVFTSAHG